MEQPLITIEQIITCKRLSRTLTLALILCAPSSVTAFDFKIGDIPAQLDTTLTVGVSKRLEDRNKYQVGISNGGVGGSENTDDGNLSVDKGDIYSKLIKGSSDFMISKGEYGFFTRARYWYDFEQKDNNKNNDDPFRASGQNHYVGAEFLDAYLWKDSTIKDVPVHLRFGSQVISWGESTFIFNGINVTNPVDIQAARAPGAEVKDVLLPVSMLYGSASLTDDISVEAYYQLKFKESRLVNCGTYFSTYDYIADGCQPIFINSSNPNEIVPRVQDKSTSDSDQFGIAMTWFASQLNETEFGIYYIQYHSRLPSIGGRVPANPLDPFNQSNGAAYYIEYPENIEMLGLSFNTTDPWGGSLAGEYSFKNDAPMQLNANDLLIAAFANPVSPVFQDRVPDADGNGIIDETDAFLGGFFGSDQKGYDRYDISQIQLTSTSLFDRVALASRAVLIFEVGATYIHDFPDADDGGIRYGRNEQLGFGLTSAGLDVCTAVNREVPAARACNTEGYTTKFSWGYRTRLSFDYYNVMDGLSLTPQLNWSHDVKGYAPDPGPNFVENRKSLGFTLSAVYLDNTQAEITYTSYLGAQKYNYLVDRDYLSMSVSYSF